MYGVDIEHSTNLTIKAARNVHTDKVEYHTHETRHARDGVDLLNEQISPMLQCGQEDQKRGGYQYGPILSTGREDGPERPSIRNRAS